MKSEWESNGTKEAEIGIADDELPSGFTVFRDPAPFETRLSGAP
jgi:hypothetical protein